MPISDIVSRGFGTFSHVFSIVDRGFTPAFKPPPEPGMGSVLEPIVTRGYGVFSTVNEVVVRGYALRPGTSAPTVLPHDDYEGEWATDRRKRRAKINSPDRRAAQRIQLDQARREIGLIVDPPVAPVIAKTPNPVVLELVALAPVPASAAPTPDPTIFRDMVKEATAATVRDILQAEIEDEQFAERQRIARIMRDDEEVMSLIAALV